MVLPILTTKLHIPPTRSKAVKRPHLMEQLEAGLSGKLTLISAPAGFGKSTLVSEWIMSSQQSAAWLSLDEGDRDPFDFLTYVVAALNTIAPHIGEEMARLLQSPQPPPIQSLIKILINKITAIDAEFILILDDYHILDNESIDTVVAFLIEYLPAQMHLVITTREDPSLPLARLRARGQLSELRAADLRFSYEEAAAFLNEVMGLDLSADDISKLEARTEGWIAGLQLAAISMQGREDVHEFVNRFAGDHRFIVDYLVEEVLQHQPESVRNFLLQTSILDRLSASLCAAITNQVENLTLLENLERGNLFVIPLDDERQWYRYHHLFADVLRAHLMKEQPDQIPILHQRASVWHENHNSSGDAIRHALAAKAFERAAKLIELRWSAMDRSRQHARWLRWAKALPEDLIRTMPVLSVGYAWALLDNGELEPAEARLRDAEKALETMPDRLIIADEDEFRVLPSTIASARAYYALALGDVPSTVQYAQQALDGLPEDDHLRRGIPASLLGLASLTSGDLKSAYRSFAAALTSFQMADNIIFAITGTYVLADIRLTQGRPREAISLYERSLQLAAAQGEPPMRGTADLHLGLSELHSLQGNLEASRQHWQKSEALGEYAALPRWKYRRCLVQARIRESQQDLGGALELLDEAEQLYLRGPVPDIRPIAALKTRVWLLQGRLSKALDWVREQGLSADDNLSYLREFEHITLARALIARYQHDGLVDSIHDALRLLERLLSAADSGERWGSVIEILVIMALAHQARGDTPSALICLENALNLAAPEGYVRIFVDEGLAMKQLLSEAAGQELMPEYTRKLLAAFEAQQHHPDSLSQVMYPDLRLLIDPLSERELEVLRLVAEGLSNHEIGKRLFLALDTVKGHNRRIYAKLGVQRRTEAVARARELGLI